MQLSPQTPAFSGPGRPLPASPTFAPRPPELAGSARSSAPAAHEAGVFPRPLASFAPAADADSEPTAREAAAASRRIHAWAGPALLHLDLGGPAGSLLAPHAPALEAQYAAFRVKSQAFRGWVAAVVFARESRRVAGEVAEIKVAAARAAARRRQLAAAWRALRRGVQAARRERGAVVAALQHWSGGVLRRAMEGWREAAVRRRPVPLYHPLQIRALFKWIALVLPDRGAWWRLSAAAGVANAPGGAAWLDATTPAAGTTAAGGGPWVRSGDAERSPGAPAFNATLAALYGQTPAVRLSSSASPTPHRRAGRAASAPAARSSSGTGRRGHARHADALLGASNSGRLLAGAAAAAHATPAAQRRRGRSASPLPMAASPQMQQLHSPVPGSSDAAAAVFAGSVLHAARAREHRLGRLRGYVVTRIAPPARKLPLLEHATAIVDAHCLLSVFVAWRVRTLAAKRSRATTLRRRACRLLADWRTLAVRQQALQRRQALATAAHSRVTLVRAWLAWRRELRDARFERAWAPAVAAQCSRWLAQRMLRRWRRYRLQSRRLADRGEERRLQALRPAFAGWRLQRAHTRALQQRAAAVAAAVRVRQLGARWQEWTTACRHAAALRRAGCMFFGSPLFKTFWALRLHPAAQRAEDAETARALQRWRMAHALRHWQQLRMEVRAGKAAAAELAAGQAGRVFAAWRSCTAERARLKRIGAGIAGRRRSKACAAAVHEWALCTRQDRHTAAARAALASAVRARAVRLCLRVWCAAVARNERARFVLAHLRNSAVSRAVRTWRERVATRQHNRALLSRCVARLRSAAVARAFASLAANVQRAQQRRAMAARVTAAATQLRRLRAVRALQGAAAAGRARKGEEARADAFAASRLLRRSLQHWSARAAAASRMRQLMGRVVATLLHGKAAAALRTWRDRAAERARNRLLIARVAGRLRNGSAAAAFAAWRAFVEMRRRSRGVMVSVVARLANARTHAAVTHWLAVVRSRLRLRTGMQRLATGLRLHAAGRAFAALKLQLAGKRDREAAADALLLRRQLALARSVVGAWRACAAREVRLRSAMLAVVRRLQHSGAARAISSWRAWTDGRLYAQQACANADAYDRRRVLGGHLQLWRLKLQRRQRAELLLPRAAELLHRAAQAAALRQWAAAAAESSRQSALLQRAVRLWSQRSLWTAWAGWREHVQARVVARGRLQVAVARMQHASAVRQLRHWRAVAHSQARLRAALTRMTQRSMGEAWNAWRGWVEARRLQRERARALAGSILRMWSRGAADSAFAGWRAWAARQASDRAAAVAVAGAARRRTLAGALERWRHLRAAHAHDRRRLQAAGFAALARRAATSRQGRQAIVAANASAKGVIIRAWRTIGVESAREGAAAAAFSARLASAPASAAALVQAAAARWAHVGVAPAFAGWLQFHRRQAARHRAKAFAADLCRQRALAACWSGWRAALQLRLREHAAALHCTLSRARRALHAWREAVAAAHAHKVLQAAALGRLQAQGEARQLRAAFGIWRQEAEAEATRCTAADQLSAAQLARRGSGALALWRAHTARTRTLRSALAGLSQRYATGYLRGVLAGWQAAARQVRQRRLLCASFAAAAAQRRAVSAWRSFTEERQAGASLRARALGFRVSAVRAGHRRLLAAWRAFTALRAAKAASAAAAAAQLNRLRRAALFAAWQRATAAALRDRAQEAAAAAFARRRALRCAQRAWAAVAQRRSAARSTGHALATSLSLHAMRAAVGEWRDLAVESRLGAAAEALWARLSAQRALVALAQHARLEAASRHCKALAVRRSVRAALRRWCQRTAQATELRRQESAGRELQGRALAALRLHAVVQQSKRARTAAAVAAVNDGVARRALVAWHVVVAAGAAYRRRVAAETSLRQRVERRRQRAQQQLLACCFRAWGRLVQVQAASRDLARRFTLHTAGRQCIARWRAAVQRRRSLQARSVIVATVARARLRVAAWSGWVLAARRRHAARQLVAVADAAARAQASRRLRAGWHAWIRATRERSAVATLQQLARTHAAVAALRAWRGAAVASRYRRQRLASAALRGWQQGAHLLRQAADGQVQLLTAACAFNHALRALRAWSAPVLRARQLQGAREALADHFAAELRWRSAAAVLHEMALVARASAAAQRLATLRVQAAARRCIRVWTREAGSRARDRLVLARAAAMRSRNLIAVVLSRWRSLCYRQGKVAHSTAVLPRGQPREGGSDEGEAELAADSRAGVSRASRAPAASTAGGLPAPERAPKVLRGRGNASGTQPAAPAPTPPRPARAVFLVPSAASPPAAGAPAVKVVRGGGVGAGRAASAEAGFGRLLQRFQREQQALTSGADPRSPLVSSPAVRHRVSVSASPTAASPSPLPLRAERAQSSLRAAQAVAAGRGRLPQPAASAREAAALAVRSPQRALSRSPAGRSPALRRLAGTAAALPTPLSAGGLVGAHAPAADLDAAPHHRLSAAVAPASGQRGPELSLAALTRDGHAERRLGGTRHLRLDSAAAAAPASRVSGALESTPLPQPLLFSPADSSHDRVPSHSVTAQDSTPASAPRPFWRPTRLLSAGATAPSRALGVSLLHGSASVGGAASVPSSVALDVAPVDRGQPGVAAGGRPPESVSPSRSALGNTSLLSSRFSLPKSTRPVVPILPPPVPASAGGLANSATRAQPARSPALHASLPPRMSAASVMAGVLGSGTTAATIPLTSTSYGALSSLLGDDRAVRAGAAAPSAGWSGFASGIQRGPKVDRSASDGPIASALSGRAAALARGPSEARSYQRHLAVREGSTANGFATAVAELVPPTSPGRFQ